jgi:signal transduction histidine kinase
VKADSQVPLAPQPRVYSLPWVGFGVTLVFLILIAVIADNITTRLADEQEWVAHSEEVERVLGRLRGDLFASESTELLDLVNGRETRLEPYYSNSQRISQDLDEIKNLTVDNPSQQSHLGSLRQVINERMGIMRESIALRNADGGNVDRLNQLTVSGAALSNQSINMLADMRREEDRLLQQRQTISHKTYEEVRLTLAIAFCVVVVVLAGNFRRLLIELRDRRQAEEDVRRLSGRLLQVQDSERRKVAREIHDGIGQIFAALKMNVSMLADSERMTGSPDRKERLLSELQVLLDQGISEARTLSHLLHPPLLDELGLTSAARWLVDGFSQRSGIEVTLKAPEAMRRMPAPIELALFRVLQESLTNIHRHSGSSSADIRINQQPRVITLVVQDYGKGIPEEILEKFRKTAAGLGVGLVGMRERVTELGGRFDLRANDQGTRLQVIFPLPLGPSIDGASDLVAEEKSTSLPAD